MKAVLRSLRNTPVLSSKPYKYRNPTFLSHFISSQPQFDQPPNSSSNANAAACSSSSDNESDHEPSDFNSANFTLPPQNPLQNGNGGRIWDESYRNKVLGKVFNEDVKVNKEIGNEERKKALARALLEAALTKPDDEEDNDEDEEVDVDDQMSVAVGIIGAPNAGKSALTNNMVGTKVSAVSRKTNTTTHEVLGVMTKGHTQICFFDTPGLMLRKSGFPAKDIKARVESAWNSVNEFDVLIVIFDVHRHLTKPDTRVVKLIEKMGLEPNLKQKRVLCMNKVDLVEKKKDLLKVSEEFKDLKGYERVFMISGLKGYGVQDLTAYLMDQAVKRPWDEDPLSMSEEVMKNISLEVVREKLLDHVHQEVPYEVEHRLVDWKDLRDGSLRIEQHFITNKESKRKILVGKNGSKIGRIGIEANEELRAIYKRNVHLILCVKLK
ncbi:GTP-binding protein ERG [Silene latifolia]|uniref:GTP-binding protein ERG n=1 Tax=Silene latifolia TaxID=37657 RepID=UPI003D76BDE2